MGSLLVLFFFIGCNKKKIKSAEVLVGSCGYRTHQQDSTNWSDTFNRIFTKKIIRVESKEEAKSLSKFLSEFHSSSLDQNC